MQTNLVTMEEHDRMDTLDSVGDSQLSYSADTESESNSCSSSSSTKTVSLLDHLLHHGSCMRKFQKEKNNNYYKNNRESFWELENNVLRPSWSPSR